MNLSGTPIKVNKYHVQKLLLSSFAHAFACSFGLQDSLNRYLNIFIGVPEDFHFTLLTSSHPISTHTKT